MRLLFLGDIVGRPGRDIVTGTVPGLRNRLGLDLVVACGENATHGFGLSSEHARDLQAGGVDVITMGNHVWDNREMLSYIEKDNRILRPANFPPGAPGRGAVQVDTPAGQVLVVQVMTRLFMDPLDCPFRTLDAVLAPHRLGGSVSAILVDLHGEASSEKMALGHHLDGRVSAVVGGHTHVPTADAQILPGGTGYQTDAGMCGDYDSVIGMRKEGSIHRFTRKVPGDRLGPADGPGTLCGIFIETDPASGLARRIEPVRVGARLAQTVPRVDTAISAVRVAGMG